MANQIQVTVVNVGGIPQPLPLSFSFLTGTILIYDIGTPRSPTALSRIDYFSGGNAAQSYFVTESIADLLSAANTDGTSMVQVTAYKVNNNSQTTPLLVCLPASAIAMQTVSQSPINTIVSLGLLTFGVSETEDDIVTAANAGGGGGGSSLFPVTGTGTATGSIIGDLGSNSFDITGTDGAKNVDLQMGTGLSGFALSMTNGVDFAAKLYMNDDNGYNFRLDDGVNSARVNMTTHGLENNADYSADYTDRSLVDKEYVDDLEVFVLGDKDDSGNRVKVTVDDTNNLIIFSSNVGLGPFLNSPTSIFKFSSGSVGDGATLWIGSFGFGEYITISGQTQTIGTGGGSPLRINTRIDTGGQSIKYVSKSSSYGITINDCVIEVTATGQTMTLPDATVRAGQLFSVKLTAVGTCTIATTSSQTIDVATTYILSAIYKYVTVTSNGANWIIIGNN